MSMSATQLEKLAARVASAQALSNETSNDQQMRNIAYCSAGGLSNGSRSRLYRWRDKLGDVTGKSLAGAFTLAVARGDVLQRHDIQRTFIALSTPVELDTHSYSANAHPDYLPLGEFANMARMIISKFDRRLAKSLPITIEMGARAHTVFPKKEAPTTMSTANKLAPAFPQVSS